MLSEIIAIFGLLLMSIVSLITLRRTSSSHLKKFIPSLDDYIQQNEAGEWVVEERLGRLLGVVGQTMFQSAKMSMLGGLSGDARLEKGLKSAISQDIIEEKFPLLDAGAGILGEFTGFNVKKYITKNPEALMQLIGVAQKNGINLAGLMGNNGAQGPGQSNSERM